MDAKNKKERLKRAGKSAAPVLPAQAAVPFAGEGVDAGVNRKMDEVCQLPSKKQKEAVALADRINTWIANNPSRAPLRNLQPTSACASARAILGMAHVHEDRHETGWRGETCAAICAPPCRAAQAVAAARAGCSGARAGCSGARGGGARGG
jgi:hypothetical protein